MKFFLLYLTNIRLEFFGWIYLSFCKSVHSFALATSKLSIYILHFLWDCNSKIVSKKNTYELFWKRSENMWGYYLPNLNIWISYQSEGGALEIISLDIIRAFDNIFHRIFLRFYLRTVFAATQKPQFINHLTFFYNIKVRL